MPMDEIYMRRALELAALGCGYVSPNPMVGAVIVGPDGRVIGEGWHRRYGGWHAEVNAVSSVRPSDEHLLEKSTIYVTLEPCSHYGKTPPCAELLVRKRFHRVVLGTIVPLPTSMASCRERWRCANTEVSGVDNLMGLPSANPIYPSALCAHLSVI